MHYATLSNRYGLTDVIAFEHKGERDTFCKIQAASPIRQKSVRATLKRDTHFPLTDRGEFWGVTDKTILKDIHPQIAGVVRICRGEEPRLTKR